MGTTDLAGCGDNFTLVEPRYAGCIDSQFGEKKLAARPLKFKTGTKLLVLLRLHHLNRIS